MPTPPNPGPGPGAISSDYIAKPRAVFTGPTYQSGPQPASPPYTTTIPPDSFAATIPRDYGSGSVTSSHEWPLNSFICPPATPMVRVEPWPAYPGSAVSSHGFTSPLEPAQTTAIVARTEEFPPYPGAAIYQSHEWPLDSFIVPPPQVTARVEPIFYPGSVQSFWQEPPATLTSPPTHSLYASVQEFAPHAGAVIFYASQSIPPAAARPIPGTLARVEEFVAYPGSVIASHSIAVPVLTSPPIYAAIVTTQPPAAFPGWVATAQVFSPLAPFAPPITGVVTHVEEYKAHAGFTASSHEWPLSSFICPPRPVLASMVDPIVSPGSALISVIHVSGVVVSPTRGLVASVEPLPAYPGATISAHAWPPTPIPQPTQFYPVIRVEEFPAYPGTVITTSSASYWSPFAPIYDFASPRSGTIYATDNDPNAIDPRLGSVFSTDTDPAGVDPRQGTVFPADNDPDDIDPRQGTIFQ